MRLASDVKGELARIEPARACCRRAELEGLRFQGGDAIRTLDPSTARVAVRLAEPGAAPSGLGGGSGARHHLAVPTGDGGERAVPWRWSTAPACDRRAFLRGLVLGSGSLSFSAGGPHVEFTFREESHARTAQRRLGASGIRAAVYGRRGRHVTYIKGRDEVATLLRLTGAHAALLEFETARVNRDVQNRLNRVLNAEAANVNRTVNAAERQLRAIERLEATGRLDTLSPRLRSAAEARRRNPDADLESLAEAMAIGRSAVHHRLRRLEELAAAPTRGHAA